MLRSPLLVAALLVAFLTGCAGSGQSLTEPSAPTLEGSWTWVESYGGKMGRTLTTKSEGHGMEMTFGANGRFVLRSTGGRDGAALATGRFSKTSQDGEAFIRYDVDPTPAQSPLNWGREQRHTVSFEAPDLLVLDEGCCDLYRHTFRRAD